MAQDYLLYKNDIEHRYSPTSLTDAASGGGYIATSIISSVTTNSGFRMSRYDAYFDLRNKLLGTSEDESMGILPQGTTTELAALTGINRGQQADNITIGRTEIYDGTDFKSVTRVRNVTGITASTTQTQGNGVLVEGLSAVSTVANINDTVTLPTAVAGISSIVVNGGSKKMKIFPNTSDNLGEGVNSSVTLASGSIIIFYCYDSTNWVSA